MVNAVVIFIISIIVTAIWLFLRRTGSTFESFDKDDIIMSIPFINLAVLLFVVMFLIIDSFMQMIAFEKKLYEIDKRERQ